MATVESAAQAAGRGALVTPRDLVVIGGGEHAGVVVDAVRTEPAAWRLLGFADPAPAPGAVDRLGIDHLGDDAAVADRLRGQPADERPWLVLAFGGTAAERRRAVERFGPSGRWATVVHATAWVSPSAALGPGTVVLAGAVVNAGARTGRHAIVNSRAVLEHDVVVGDFAHLAPGVIVGGGARIGARAFVGLGALVRDHVEIGDGATVGMGAVVVGPVPPDTVVLGSPASSDHRTPGGE